MLSRNATTGEAVGTGDGVGARDAVGEAAANDLAFAIGDEALDAIVASQSTSAITLAACRYRIIGSNRIKLKSDRRQADPIAEQPLYHLTSAASIGLASANLP